ncbi:hypothetical protein C8F04DRAFT_1194828 [Mycena alexandri]|uniref:F-box domain-containing protein n=1 Tax=Mycena alexandri TaxID=1745969 RepID=A0AAD6WSP9_9AGAR|nr:hypothetical protein C8F04DRAFT_1194828 [Mycena alexandri]
MGLNDFPPELLTSILLNLPYKSLLSLQAVCVQWKAIVVADPASVSSRLRNPVRCLPAGGLKAYISYGLRYEEHTSPESEPVRLHPAIQEASFDIGDDFAEMPLILAHRRSENADAYYMTFFGPSKTATSAQLLGNFVASVSRWDYSAPAELFGHFGFGKKILELRTRFLEVDAPLHRFYRSKLIS